MKDKKDTPLWCPFGRISIQRREDGVFREGVPGAYNMLVEVDFLRGKTGDSPQPATPCIRNTCALWQQNFWDENGGHCRLARQGNVGPWVFAALIAFEVIAICASAYMRLLP